MGTNALEARHLTKEYHLYASEFDRLRESFSLRGKSYHRNFYALRDLSFTIGRGEKVGIIGANGAGKSTLLKIVTGVLSPTQGEIIADGKIAALLELGAGFNQDYSGLENIRLNGALMGYSDAEIQEKTQKIIDFADIGDFIDQPVKSYSSGMFVRLAFATQIFSDPDILIVDEALSVGDIRFQQKCFRAMESLMRDKTVVLVTHDTAAVTRFCQRVLWIHKGQLLFDGDVTEGLKRYKEFLINQAIEERRQVGGHDFADVAEGRALPVSDGALPVPPVASSVRPKGNGEAEIYACGLFSTQGTLIDLVEPGETVKCVVRVAFRRKEARPILGLAIRDRLGNEAVGINSETLGLELPLASGRREYVMTFRMPELNQGSYTVTIAIANGYQSDHVQMCWLDDALVFRIPDRPHDVPGMIYLEHGSIDAYEIRQEAEHD